MRKWAPNKRRPTTDEFWTRHVSRKARVIFFAGVGVLWSAQALVFELAAGRPASAGTIAAWALYSGLTGAAWAWCFIYDLRGLFIVLPLSSLLPWFFGDGFWDRTPDSHRLVVAIATLAAMIVSYILFIRFIITEAATTLRMRTEMNLAREIHATLVPPITLETARVTIHGASYPTTEVGGDLLDALSDADSDAVFLADVSGHGVPAGVLMAMIRSAIRVRVRTGAPLAQLVCDVNTVVHEATEPRMFATFAALRFLPGAVEYAIAGHLPILWYRRDLDRIEHLDNEHPPLGILPGHPFTARRVTASPGDVFVLFTDGLTEVRDRKGEEYGEERFEALMRQHIHSPVAELHAAFVDAARAFGTQDDDQTVVVMRTSAL